MTKGDVLYYARVLPSCGIFEVCELKVRTVEDKWFVGADKSDKHAYLFSNSAISDSVFVERKDALAKVKKAEKELKIKDEYTVDYEEY